MLVIWIKNAQMLDKINKKIENNFKMFRFMIVYENCYQCYSIIFEYWTVNTYHGETI